MNRKLFVDCVMRGTLSLAILVGASGRINAQSGLPLNPDEPNQPQAITTQVGAAFSYQGQIKKSGSAVSGTCDFQFSLWNDGGAGAQIGDNQTQNGIVVKNGLFTTQLDFGNRFTGDIRWLQIAVKCAGDSGFVVLGRQMLTPSPYALGLMPETIVNGDVPLGPQGRAVFRANNTGVGMALWGESTNGVGVLGKSLGADIGVYGISIGHEGVRGVSYHVDHGAVVGVHEAGGSGIYGLSKGNGVAGISTNGAIGVLGRSDGGTEGVGVKGESSTGAGVVGKNTGNWVGVYGESNTSHGVWGVSNSGSGVIGKSTSWIGIYGESSTNPGVFGVSTSATGVTGKSTSGHGVWAETASPNNSALYAKNTGGGKAAFFDGRATTRIFEIIGGSDLAERFNLSSEAEPGTLLVIDEANPGLLKPSTTAYDTKIAGIVSGAGGVNPGLTLHQEGVLEGNTEVAIAGRVYVKATAANGPIKPGDLLTTSDIAGYAMRATDRERAYGAVIGKAMTGLESGTGLVLVLVNLQ